MRKETYENNLAYEFHPERKGAKYRLVGKNEFMNHGDYAECLAKSVLGLKPEKDANTPFDKGEDIEELGASVKSSKSSLTDMKLGTTKEEFLFNFWNRSNAKLYIWVVDHDEMVDLYYMTESEFKQFVDAFCRWDAYSVKMRFLAVSGKMIKWLDERI